MAFRPLGDRVLIKRVEEEETVRGGIVIPPILKDVIRDLIANARKYTAPGGQVRAALHSSPDGVHLTVEDTGCGIPAAELPQLFDRFYQSRATVAPASADTGRGLGLAIVKRIVELHEGEVAAESGVGVGTRITTRWPAAA